MFIITTIADTIRIPPSSLKESTLSAIHKQIDYKYPNRVIMDVGLVICRYGNSQIGDGVCVAGDGGAHFECITKLLVFRPFLNEVILGTIIKSNKEGLQVSLGFFDTIFIPAYWMLRPSHYDNESGLWIWTPNFDEDDDDEDESAENGGGEDQDQEEEEEEENRFEMEIGAQIRFKIKAINFTRVINTAKGVQATTTTTSQQSLLKSSEAEQPVRKRSTSADLSEASQIPASMHIVGSICEDGLGLTSWWTGASEQEVGEEEEAGGAEQQAG